MRVIFTDGSKNSNDRGGAFYDPNIVTDNSLNNRFKSIYDLLIILLGLITILGYNSILICMDWNSALHHRARCASGGRGVPLAYMTCI